MSFLNLWVALAIAAAVIPALIILYFLKLRRREEVVPSTLLWKRAVQDLQVNAPFQRLRKNLLLLLQLLILLAGLTALARPIIKSTATDERSVVILIDRSASMNSREGNETRLDLAKQQAERLVKTLNRTGSAWFSFSGAKSRTRAMVIAFADRATVISPFTTNVDELVELIGKIEPTDGLTNLKEALDLAEAYMLPTMSTVENAPVSPEPESKLVLISDGGVADMESLVLKGGSMELIRIGKTHDNTGITALRTQRNYEQPELLDAFVQVRNFAAQEAKTDVTLYVDGKLQSVQSVTLAAAADEPAEEAEEGGDPASRPASTRPVRRASGGSAALTFSLQLPQAAVLEARLARDDALAVDNHAWAVAPPPRKLRVLVVAAKGGLLPAVLRGLPLEQTVFKTPAEYEAAPASEIEVGGQSKYDVVILHSHNTARLPAGNYLFFAAVPQIEGVKATGSVENFALMWWDESHAVLRNVALEEVKVARGLTLEVPREAETLVEGPQGPVLARYAKDGRHCMIMTFTPEESTWWRAPGFPIFVYNALQYLGSGGTVADQAPTRPGDALRISLPAGASMAKVTRPDGATVSVTADAGGVVHYAGTQRVGVYRVEPGVEGRDRFAVNLEDDWESDIAPRGDLKIGSQKIAEAQAIKTATPEVWRWFVGTALVILLIEWYIYNRRVMI